MSLPLWSICMLTVPERKDKFERARARLEPQIQAANGKTITSGNEAGNVELLVCETPLCESNETPLNSIGQKRNILLARSRARFVSFVDDDDLVSEDYVSSILEMIALDDRVQCVTFNVGVAIRHKLNAAGLQREKITRYSPFFENRDTAEGYERHPNHVAVWSRQICLPYQEIGRAEDTDWAMRMRWVVPSYRWKNIDRVLYHYRHDQRDSVQYGNVGRVSAELQDSEKISEIVID